MLRPSNRFFFYFFFLNDPPPPEFPPLPHPPPFPSPHPRPPPPRRKLQSLLVGAQALGETPLRNPYIGRCDGAAERVGVVPGPPQTRHASGIRLMCGLE